MFDPKDLDLGLLTLMDLEQLAERVEREISDRQEEGRRWLEEGGHHVLEKPRPVYRNPRNASQTWTGQGSRPAWVEEALAEGHSLASLASDEPTAERAVPVAIGRTGLKTTTG